MAGGQAAPLLLVTDPSREISVSVLQGAMQKAYFSSFPDAVLRNTARILEDRFLDFNQRQTP